MFVDFDKMARDSRVWLYQSDRDLTAEEQNYILEQTEKFLNTWVAHGTNLNSSVKIFYKRFLVILVDEKFASVSGCSIDSSVRFVKALETELNVNFFDRTKVAFLDDGNVFLESLNKIKNRISEGIISGDTLTFNNLIKNKAELEESWMVPASETWLSRYL
ncbi:MAG: hypothetical protein IH947_00910 [Bacteroidetes bacterium]|nr:hypothetical protein [Bacteroidota bacterium]MCH8231864.1 hypothetical protein [Bacteroidota bacterium]